MKSNCRNERQGTNWEKISDKGIISKLYQELLRLNKKQPNKVMSKIFFFRREAATSDTQMAIST